MPAKQSKRGVLKDTPFNRYLKSRGLRREDLGQFHSVARRLAQTPDTVAPNSPLLVPFAEFLDIPLRKLQNFATGELMSDQFVLKIQNQMEHGTTTNQHGKHGVTMSEGDERGEGEGEVVVDGSEPIDSEHTAPIGKQGNGKHGGIRVHGNTTKLTAYMVARYNTTPGEVGRKLGLPNATIWRMSAGTMAPNHPLLQLVADHLGAPIEDLAQFMKPNYTPLSPGYIERAQAAMDKSMKKGARVGVGRGNGRRHKAEVMPAPERDVAYNRLGSARSELALRQSARAMIATLNVQVMQGATHMPPIPVADLYLVLADYLQEKGVKVPMLVDPTFADVFDPSHKRNGKSGRPGR